MDRFGDDLTEKILQYLTFEDKIRLECVSKQWQRCVYQRQYVIEIDVFRSGNNQNSLNELFRRIDDERQSDEQKLVSVVKKCPNITKVILRRVSRSGVFAIASRLLNDQGSGIGGGRGGRGGYTPPWPENFENTPPPEDLEKIYPPLGGARRRRHFFAQILEINVNLTGFSLNLVKLTLI